MSNTDKNPFLPVKGQTSEYNETKELMEDKYNVVHDHPKATRLFELAWEFGHSGGVSEIENYYMDLVDLIQ